MQPENFITSLTDSELDWWKSAIQEFRTDYIKTPKHYAMEIITGRGLTKESIIRDMDGVIASVREEAWQLYLQDEAEFHAAVLKHLFVSRELPRNILEKVIKNKGFTSSLTELTPEQLAEKVSEVVGEFTGRVMPYIYNLSLSTTQSRRSRSGKTFEHIIETLMDIFGLPYDTQSSVGTGFFERNSLGKKVDLLVPGAEKYIQNRSKSAVVSAKTTLRERWQEVAEEISRTNVPHIYLLTVDKDITANVVKLISRYNITLVVYGSIKEKRFSSFDNVTSFDRFFTKEMPHIVDYWKE